MTTPKYTKAKFEELQLRVAEKVYQYGIDNNSCRPDMIGFIADSLDITEFQAEGLLESVEKKHMTKYRLQIDFSSTDPNVEVWNAVSLSEFIDLFNSIEDSRETDEIDADSIKLIKL